MINSKYIKCLRVLERGGEMKDPGNEVTFNLLTVSNMATNLRTNQILRKTVPHGFLIEDGECSCCPSVEFLVFQQCFLDASSPTSHSPCSCRRKETIESEKDFRQQSGDV